ncbi:Hpt domain-containing protein [Sphingomonas crocodyli]|uniref:Hpt domain-containing protein n=1 Tax=Sphingomonas crocodyli TaxID=1979270 RepID=A0A437LY08_9SPHN|nr:Hpt domain-containing protein [Sphingomonas crocodyli]
MLRTPTLRQANGTLMTSDLIIEGSHPVGQPRSASQVCCGHAGASRRHIDRERRDRLRAYLPADFERLCVLYSQDAVRWIATIEAAIVARKTCDAAQAAHILKGDSFQLGAERLGFIAHRIEQLASMEPQDRTTQLRLRGLVSQLRAVLDRSLTLLLEGSRSAIGSAASASCPATHSATPHSCSDVIDTGQNRYDRRRSAGAPESGQAGSQSEGRHSPNSADL